MSMSMTVLKVLYVVVAILMSAFILLQRGAGAQQGGGFGAGASATVFGASGSANFLSKSTKWLAALFFGLSILMAAMISQSNTRAPTAVDAGVMGSFSETPELGVPAVLPATSEVPAPVAVEGAADPSTVAPVNSEIPAVSPAETPAPTEVPAVAPADAEAKADKPAGNSDN